MLFELVNANAVIVAHHFNPTITDQIWLDENGIVNRDEPIGSFIFSDMLAQIPAKEFHLLIVPDRCQFTPSPESERQQELVVNRLGTLVEKLPHTPYQAVGLNFTWHLRLDGDLVSEYVRSRFFVQGSPLHQAFDVPDAMFGGYMSMNYLECRLKLDVKPVTVEIEDNPVEVMQFAFNLNKDISPDVQAVSEIRRVLAYWNDARSRTESIMRSAVEGLEP